MSKDVPSKWKVWNDIS